MSILRSPKTCIVCGKDFVPGDKVIFERKATVVEATGPRRWTPEGVRREHYIGITQSSARISAARHEVCP